MPTKPIFFILSLVLSSLALSVSIAAFWFQHLRTRGAKIILLDEVGSEPQTSTVLPYPSLPPDISNHYPDYNDPRGYYALARIPFANEGNRPGYVKFSKVRLESGLVEGIDAEDRVRFSWYSYLVVPDFGAALHTILIRNLPQLAADTRIKIEAEVEIGRVLPKGAKVERIQRKLHFEVLLKAPNPELPVARPGKLGAKQTEKSKEERSTPHQ